MMMRRRNVTIYGPGLVLAGLLIGPTRSVAQVLIDGTQYCNSTPCNSSSNSYTIPSASDPLPANPTNEIVSLPSGNSPTTFAIITQSGSSNVLTGTLSLGTEGTNDSYGLGLYDLQGGSLSATTENVGGMEAVNSEGELTSEHAVASEGVFTQEGGTNTATTLDILGDVPPPPSSNIPLPVSCYTITGGSLVVSGTLYVGGDSKNDWGNVAMTIGANAKVSAATLQIGGINIYGQQEDGVVSSGALTLSAGASLQFGTMDITLGSVSAMGNLVLGESGSSVLNQSGNSYATHVVQDLDTSVASVGSLELGVAKGNNGFYS